MALSAREQVSFCFVLLTEPMTGRRPCLLFCWRALGFEFDEGSGEGLNRRVDRRLCLCFWRAIVEGDEGDGPRVRWLLTRGERP